MSRNDAVHHAVEGVLDLHRHRVELLRADPRPKIGYASIQTPEEILLAAGLLPFRPTGEHGIDTSDASARLGHNYCSYVLSLLSEGIAGRYDFADGVVFADACDLRKRLWEAWQRDVREHDAYFLELPNDAGPLSKEFFALQVRKLLGELERRYRRTVDDEALREAIRTCNRSRALMRRLYEYKKGERQALSGLESIQVVQAATTGLKELFNARLSALLEALERAELPAARKRHRVMICGSYFDHQGIIETIEQTGADIVCEDISNGVKYFEGEIDLSADPVTAIADYYLDKHTSARILDTDVRIGHLLDLARDYRVDSVIYYALKFCDTNLHDYPYVRERLHDEELPVLFIEGERNATNIAGAKTRIQTFLEARMF